MKFHLCTTAFVASLAGLACSSGNLAWAAEFKAGVATSVITPSEPIWLGGYGSRTQPADGKVHDLHCKVLALQDARDYAVVLITIDTENVPRAFADSIAAELIKQHHLRREQIVVSTSHTHCGPGLASIDAKILYPMTPEQYAATERYTDWLAKCAIKTANDAIGKLEPAELSYGKGDCPFGVNRRNNKEADTGKEGFMPVGPVDHDVPVLCVRTQGKLKAVLFGYACHCTTMSFQQWCGDWAGFAKLDVEAAHPGATALFMTGCGADTNPLPRRKIELCQSYGRQLAESVEQVISKPMRPIHGRLQAAMTHVDLAYDTLPSREQLEQYLSNQSAPRVRWAKYILQQMYNGGHLPASYSYGVQNIRLGNELDWVVLSGEVVVDYALRLKRELGPDRTWVFGYCNDLCAYMPSERVLKEGGYEGGEAMYFYGHPTAWAPGLEEKIVTAAHQLANATSRPE